ncbi:MAG: methyltransferase domain-containing protein [Pseudomonadota bacterium]
MSILQWIKNKVKISKTFWRFRHLIDRKVMKNYYNNFNSERRNFYSEFTNLNKIKSVFEYGCASGPNLANIRENCESGIFLFGYDINPSAIKYAKKRFDQNTSIFVAQLRKREVFESLRVFGYKKFDLAIYDRILYLLTEDEIRKHLLEFADLFLFVIVDDFHNESFVDSNGAYHSKNYKKIFDDFGFDIIIIDKSQHLSKERFFDENAKRLVFKKRAF